MKKIILFLILLTLSSFSFADLTTVKVYLNTKDVVNDHWTSYISGVGNGYVVMNASIEKHLFCVPDKLALNADNFKNILDDQIEKYGEKINAIPIEVPLLNGLKTTFPCKK